MTAPRKPKWLKLGDQLMGPLIGMGLAATQAHRLSTDDLHALPFLALCHHAGCLEASDYANRHGKHSAAVCLVRQSVEALTIVEIGLQDPSFAEPLIADWKEGRKSQGELRKALEQTVWPRYGLGLWHETWAEFYANLARSVQPYAHYTPELQGWQFAAFGYDGDLGFWATFGPETYDALQASRVTLLHVLLTWMLGRILLAHGKSPDVLQREQGIRELGKALSSSKLLFKGGDWGVQLAPHMLFKPGVNWRDET